EGHLDAATGFVVFRLLQRTAQRFGRDDGSDGVLAKEIDEYRTLMRRRGSLRPQADTLDLGMGLWICHFFRDEPWAATLAAESLDLTRVVLDPD
ncbi:hypothetical protein ABTO49_20480, partial [Acinetobacter baumannii]